MPGCAYQAVLRVAEQYGARVEFCAQCNDDGEGSSGDHHPTSDVSKQQAP